MLQSLFAAGLFAILAVAKIMTSGLDRAAS